MATRRASDNAQALDAFMAAKAQIDAMLGRLKAFERRSLRGPPLQDQLGRCRHPEPFRQPPAPAQRRSVQGGANMPLDPAQRHRIEKDASCAMWDAERLAACDDAISLLCEIADLDIRFKRINHNESVRPKTYDRMISQRRQIAELFLSEGSGEAARIRGNRERDLNKIQSEAYRAAEEIRGVADDIHTRGHNINPQAAEFYEFTRAMQA